jgi:hypothetical protein
MTERDLFYLRSILRNLDELRQISMLDEIGYGVANETLEDNRDWLDCFIARFERSATAAAPTNDAA